MDSLDMQKKLVMELVNLVQDPWDAIEVHYEYFVWDGNVMEQYTAVSIAEGLRTTLDLPWALSDLMLEMHDTKPHGQGGSWTSMDLKIEPTGKYKFDFGYDTPPMAARRIHLWVNRDA